MEAIVEILESIPIKSFFALHDNTKRKLIKFNLYNRLKKNKKIKIIKPMSYIDFIYQLSKCDLILCDGGSMQEESLLFNKPCIVLRKETERQEGLKTNFQFLSRFNVGKTKQKILEYLNPNFKVKKVKNPYGKNVSKKSVQINNLEVRVEIHEKWLTKDGAPKRKDIANREKFLIDSIFDAFGWDDKGIFKHIMIKVQSEKEFAVVTIK
jgi:UDP-N-acetylglucosamine 2-epimerase